MENKNEILVPAHDLYVSFTGSSDDISFSFGTSADEAKMNLLNSAVKKKNRDYEAAEATIQPDQSNPVDRYNSVLLSINGSMEGYNELISLSGTLAKTVIGPLTTQKSVKYAKENLDLVLENDNIKVYGMRGDKTLDFMSLMDRHNSLISGFLFLPPAILMGCVSFYDAALSDILRVFLSLNPDRFKNSDKTFTASQLFKMSSIDNIVDNIIDAELDSLMRGSHSNQIDYIEKIAKISIKNDANRWSSFIEIFERRNIISHNNGIVNDIYIQNCKNAGVKNLPPLGVKLKLSAGYLQNAAGTLHEVLLIIIFELWSKIENDKKERLYFGITETSFRLLSLKSYRTSYRILEYVLGQNDQLASEEARRMMTVNLAIAKKFISKDKSFESELDRFQWDSSSDKFRICIAALREDINEVKKLIPRVRLSEDIKARDFQTWPVFYWIRSNPSFLEAVREAYGVQLQNT